MVSLNQRAVICFNPRARDGRETPEDVRSLPLTVSIHAPVMDANHTPHGFRASASFNPRARDGREDYSLKLLLT